MQGIDIQETADLDGQGFFFFFLSREWIDGLIKS